MSGSGNGPADYGGPERDCRSVRSRAIINSPNQNILSQLALNDIVELSLQSSRGPIIALFNDDIIGSVLPTAITEIIECMNSGIEFHGRVVTLDGAHCEILITAK